MREKKLESDGRKKNAEKNVGRKKKYRFFASLGHFDNFFFSYENIVEKKSRSSLKFGVCGLFLGSISRI